MKGIRALCAAVVLAAAFVPAGTEAASSSLTAFVSGLGDPFDGSSLIDYHPLYWSGAYAYAWNGGVESEDDQYDPSGYLRPNEPTLTATASVGSTLAKSGTDSGSADLTLLAMPDPGSPFADAYAEVDHWIDFETTLLVNEIGISFGAILALETGGPSEQAYAWLYGWAGLQQWFDDDGDGLRGEDEWYDIDYIDFGDLWFVEDGDDYFWMDGDEYWFAPFGPGVYSLGFGLYADAEVAVPVPVPGALVLGGLGAGLIGWLRRRRTL